MSNERFNVGRTAERVPTRHLLGAALRAVRALNPESGTPIANAHHAYAEVPTGGIFHSGELIAGERLLLDAELIEERAGSLFPIEEIRRLADQGEPDASEGLLYLLLEREPPLWLTAATSGGDLQQELIPDGDVGVLEGIIPDLARREALLLAAARRHDAQALAALGALGEQHVVRICRQELQMVGREDLVVRVRQVSKQSDQLGWDIDAPTLSDRRRRLEVKTTRAAGPLIKCYLSRNEARVGMQDPEWSLVVCRAINDDQVEIVGWCGMEALAHLLPTDKHHQGRWESVSLTIDEQILTPKIPSI